MLTNGSIHDAKQLAQAFEEIRYVFVLRFQHENLESGAPLTVFAVRDEHTLRQLQPELWSNHRDGSIVSGVFFSGWESQYAMVRMDSWASGFGRDVVFHEYTHSVLHANAHWLPLWLDEGLAEFYAYTRFEGKRIYVGAPAERFGILRSRPLIPIDDMLQPSRQKQLFRDPALTDMFYAEAWGMVHYMMFGQGMRSGDMLQSFYRMLQDGVPQPEAFRKVFGDPAPFELGLRQYLTRFLFSAGVLPAPPDLDKMTLTVRKLSPAETDFELGAFAASRRRDETAHDLLQQAVTLDPHLAGAHQALGFLEFRTGDDAGAREQWAQALQLDPNLDRSLFAETMSFKPLHEQTPAELASTQSSLEKVVALAPNFAPAWIELARLAWKSGKMQLAYDDAKRAESLEPWRAGYHLLTGRILLNGGHPDMAAGYAEYVAKRWEGPDHDEAVDLWNEVPAKDRGTDPPLGYDLAEGTAIVGGFLQLETCGKPGWPVMISVDISRQNGAPPIHLVSNGNIMIGFSDTFWWGEDHFSQCNHLAGYPVLAVYRRASGSGPDTLLELEVRDPWPGAFDEDSVSASSASPQAKASPAL